MGVTKTLKLKNNINTIKHISIDLDLDDLRCTKCGKNNPSNTVFCTFCGGELELADNFFQISPTLMKSLKKKVMHNFLTLITLAVIIMNLKFAVFFFNLTSGTLSFSYIMSNILMFAVTLAGVFMIQLAILFFTIQLSSIFNMEYNFDLSLIGGALFSIPLYYIISSCF